MRFYPTGSSSQDVPRFCLRVAVYGRDGKSVSLYCNSSIVIRVFTKMNAHEKDVSDLTDIHKSKFVLQTPQLRLVSTISFTEFFHLKHGRTM